MSSIQKLSTFALVMLITGAIDSIRNLPASALFGSTLIFFFIFAAIVFLIPTALVSAELSANLPEGGIYQWATRAFGKRVGFLAVWLQWVNNIFWFPTILSFIAGTAAYLIDPALAENKWYLVGVILSSFWLLTLINLKGIHLSAKITSFCAIVGLLIPITFIIILLIVWVAMGNPLQIELTPISMLPNFQHADNWIALTAIMLSFCGMELATVHIKEVANAQKTFPKAVFYSTLIILFTMMLGSLAIAFVLPHDQINLVNGAIQTFSYFLSVYNLSWLTPILTLLLIIGSLGGIISWIVSPIKGLAQAGKNGFLPPFLYQENKHGVPQNLLLMQAILVSIVCSAFLFEPSINGSYWLLTALTTQVYMLMYVIMFLAALRLRNELKNAQNGFVIPGKKWGIGITCLLGLVGCMMTIAVGFIPPNSIEIGNKLSYEILFCVGLVIMISPVLFFYGYETRKKNTSANIVNKLEK